MAHSPPECEESVAFRGAVCKEVYAWATSSSVTRALVIKNPMI